MKKVFIIALMLFCGMANAQNYLRRNISEITEWQTLEICTNEYDGVIIEKELNCDWVEWIVRSDEVQTYHTDEITITPNATSTPYDISYYSDGDIASREFFVTFSTFDAPEPWTQEYTWMRTGDQITLDFYGDYSCQWSTGSTDHMIIVSSPGTYWVRIYNDCGYLYDTIRVYGNVEIYRAGVDPATNKNRVLWQTTPEQATYVSSVKVERDGMVVGTVPYLDGQFLDNIGSENAARVYRITAIASDGTECPIPSYQFGTFNTVISPDIANPSLMNFTWEDPFIEEGSPYSVVAYRIGRFNENTGEFIVIDQLSANVHLGKYNMDLFDGDYGIVAAVFNDAKNRDNEELAFSNRSDNEIVGVDELNAPSFSLYPNPSHGEFIVEGPTTITICNLMGQVVAMSQNENGVHTISINTPGVYFVKSDEGTRKVVIE